MATAPTPQPEALRLADELMEPTLWPTDIRNLGAAELRRLHAENARLRAEQAQAMSEASSLAMSLFQKHYSSDPDYASGAVKFGLCDELRGVISQIDNMSTGLTRAELEARKPLSGLDAMRMGMEVGRECRGAATGTTNWATAMTRAYERRLCGITGGSS